MRFGRSKFHRLWATLALAILVSPLCAAEGFTFVQLCDTQLGMGGYEHDAETFKLAVKHINRLEPDFVLVCGDLINDTDDDQAFRDFNAIKAGFAVPAHCSAGNHDVANEPTVELLERYRRFIGEDRYAFDHKGYTFVAVNTSLWKSPVAGETEAQDAWFEETLKEADDRDHPIFVFGHYPPFNKSPDDKEGYFNLPLKQRERVLSLMHQHGAVAFLAGHVHRNQVSSDGDILVVASASTSKNFDGAPMGFRLWTIGDDGSMEHEYVPVEGAQPPAK